MLVKKEKIFDNIVAVSGTKKEAIRTISRLCAKQTMLDATQLEEAFWKREEWDSTGCGEGIAIPHAIIIRKNIFGKYKLLNEQKNDCPLSREEALKLVVDYLEATDLVVSTTGKLSRELFEYREAEGEGHECDFLTVGSMGHSSSIALGIALANSERRVFCLDGDGAFIMHMGAIGNIGYLSPKNYFHILFNNGSHESVGGQPTIGFQLDIPAIAKACGYRTVFSLTTKDEIKEILQQTKIMEGPVLIELKVKVASRDDLGRPTTTPLENKFHFMEFLKNK